MIDWKKKLSSRKFWAMLAALVLSVLTAVGIPELRAEQVVVIVSGVGALVAYMLAEGAVDKASASLDNIIVEVEPEEPEYTDE